MGRGKRVRICSGAGWGGGSARASHHLSTTMFLVPSGALGSSFQPNPALCRVSGTSLAHGPPRVPLPPSHGLSPFCSGKKSVATTKTSTPSVRTRCAMSSSPTRTIGSSPRSSTGVELTASTPRCASLCGTAAASPMSQAPARRPSTSITTRQTLSLPPRSPPSGRRHPTSKWTPLLLTRASPRWTLVAG